MDPEYQPTRRTFSHRIEPMGLESVLDALSHGKSREKIFAMIKDYVGQVEFEELVMKYAGKEIERRSLGNIRFWFITIMTAVITAIITTAITLYVHR